MSKNAAPPAPEPAAYRRFAEFYPYYLSEHSNRNCRRIHFVGSSLGLLCLALLLVTGNLWWLPAGLIIGYAFAWVGHFYFEKNRPATFKYPFFSFAGDWVMWKDIATGKIKF
jgi:hypothetical protein